MNPEEDLNYYDETHSWLFKQQKFDHVGNWSPYWEWYGVFDPYIVIDDHSYDGNHWNGIIDLTN